MTEFREHYNPREFDPRLIIHACQFYLRQFDLHIRNVEHLHTNTIKFYADRLLESIFTIEDYANMIYDDLPDKERKKIDKKEEDRELSTYLKSDGNDIDEKTFDTIEVMMKAVKQRYDNIRADAKDKVNKDKEQMI